ncbi:carbohydrate porin [Klebsiella pneumoniae subsp. pneumoniae]|nr:carbohydrate porin [Klebsiella pneumoniae subsp. pneumoniae]
MENRKNVVYVRPVAAWQSGAWSAAAAIESNLVNNAYGYQSQSGRWVDQSNRTGYGLTMSWNTPEKRSAGWGGGQSEYRPAGRGGRNRLQRRDQRPLASRGAGLYLCAQ